LDRVSALAACYGRLLRIPNREDYDVYLRPYSGDRNAGYILLDLDQPTPGVLARLQTQGHEPSVVVETSPGRWQAWIRISSEPLLPALATRIARRLAQLYAADPASVNPRPRLSCSRACSVAGMGRH
jgi:hypothetical protein